MSEILREYRMKFERVAPDQHAVDPAADGLRSKLGGRPTWIQNDETPTCPVCAAKMTFVAQIDSIEHQHTKNPHQVDALSPEQQYMFGDVGLIYVFLCFDCLETTSILQCY